MHVGFIGAGNYASSMLLPHLQKNEQAVLAHVATNKSLSAANAQKKFGFEAISTDADAVLDDDPRFRAAALANREAMDELSGLYSVRLQRALDSVYAVQRRVVRERLRERLGVFLFQSGKECAGQGFHLGAQLQRLWQ